MGKEYTEIDERLQRWMARQQMFFVATAPRSDGGLVNCSPKGLDCLVVLDPTTLAYADVGGSGIETVAHLKENGRITIMMCAFAGPPKIWRFFGKGRVTEPHQDGFAELASRFPGVPVIRDVITVEIERIRDSCGYGVPLYEFQKQRDSFENYFSDKADAFLHNYRRERNAVSLDGLPGLEVGQLPGGSETAPEKS